MRAGAVMLVWLTACAAAPRPSPAPPPPPPAPVAAPAQALSGDGSNKAEAVEVCGVGEEYAILRLLRCPATGTPVVHALPKIRRLGNVGARLPRLAEEPEPTAQELFGSGPLPPGARDHHVVDLFEVVCAGATTRRVFVDMYHCPRAR